MAIHTKVHSDPPPTPPEPLFPQISCRLSWMPLLQSAFWNLQAAARDDRRNRETMKLLYREAFASVGARLAPLTSLDEAAAFFLAAAANGPLTHSRASTIA